jgi:hypothetical protein
VDGSEVRFADGSADEVDAIVFGTGYALDLPFLGASTRAVLAPDAAQADLHHFTFHPSLPGLALVGLYDVIGPFFPTVELQARWVAYSWSGRRPAPTGEAMAAGLAASRARREQAGPDRAAPMPMHVLARMFAREAGVEPDPVRWPRLARALMFGPLSPASFRLSGPDALSDAESRVVHDAAAFGAVPVSALTSEQGAQLRALAAARHDETFTAFVESVTGAGAEPGERHEPWTSSTREPAMSMA